MSLRDYGWDDFFEGSFKELRRGEEIPARVLWAASGTFRLRTEDGTRQASVAGRLRRGGDSGLLRPAVGDWVAARPSGTDEARIERVLKRRSTLSRKVAGKRSEEQVVAANVDLAIVVMGLDGDFNVRRLERFLTAVWESDARPVALLSKADLCDDVEARRAQVEHVAVGVPVLVANCLSGEGVEAVRERILPRETAVLVGSSGVGKSTLINRLLGREAQRTLEVREGDDRGRHATTRRELFRLPGGGLLIDSPGIRELQLWGGDESLERAFEDIASLAGSCRFRDCLHEAEAGCAVLRAVEDGSLEPSRLVNYHKLQKELRYLHLRQSESAQRIQKQKWREIHREIRRPGKYRK